jgi:hypothetical protein
METGTMASDFQMQEVQNIDTATIDNVSGNFQPNSVYNQQSFISNTPTTLLSQEKEEEERRRRAALLGMGAPLLGSLAVEGMPGAENVPMVQGTPQIGGVPTVQGTPHPPADSMGQGFYASPTVVAPQLPNSIPVSPIPGTTVTLHHPQQPHPSPNKPHGCSLVFIIAAILIPVLIILTFIGLGLTLFAPSLSLSGSATIVQGGTFTIHGSHFIPGSSVTLTLDDTIPLYFSSRSLPVQSAQTAKISMQTLSLDMQQGQQSALSNNTVSVGGDGTFAVTITANPNWVIGEHTITAAESLTHRSAHIVITINPAGTTPTPITSGSTTPSPSPSPTTTLTPTATTTLPGLSCINPSKLSLGPVIQGYNQPVSSQVTLCTTGSGTVNWTATWDQNAAPWLHLDHTSGQISAPGQVQVTASAVASNLAPGNYSVMLAFTGQPDNSTESLQISFTVQGGCASGNPNTLSFSGVANVSDPMPQTVTITNCGPTGAWSATTQTNNGGNWLYASPTAGTLNAGASSNVTITASNLKAQLTAGTYTGSVTLKIGTGTSTIYVTLTVMPAPTLSARPISIYANQQCKINLTGGLWLCTVLLTNHSNTSTLHWSASSSGIKGISFSQSNGTLAPGQTLSVQVRVPLSDCPIKGILSFTGPVNTANVEWYCIAG